MSFDVGNVSEDKKTGLTFRGKEITLSRTMGRPRSGLVKIGMENGVFPEEKKIEAVTIYAATGSMEAVEKLSDIPVSTFKKWRKEPWFHNILIEVRNENNEKIDARFTEIVEKTLNALVDRLDNGDFVVLKDGSITRKPVSARDLSLVGAINIDKRQLLRGEPTSRQGGDERLLPVAKKLERLAETFENLAKIGRKKTDVIDVDFVEVKNATRSGTETESQSQDVASKG